MMKGEVQSGVGTKIRILNKLNGQTQQFMNEDKIFSICKKEV